MRTEHEEQSLVVAWAQFAAVQHPELEMLFAIPNGGDRNVVVATKLKREGVQAGVPDLCLPVRSPQGLYAGLWIEMKRKRARQTKTKGIVLDRTAPTRAQRWWHERLRRQGYAVAVCWSAEEAQDVITRYIAGEAIAEA